jgi:RNA polymerase sigma factor (sigma-70 family)
MRDTGRDRWLRNLPRVPLLTADEEQALARRVQGDDADDARAARDELVRRNVGLVCKLASWHARRWKRPIEDMDQDGMMGLVKAAERYEPGRHRFVTYAVYWIRQSIQEGTRRDVVISMPRAAWGLIRDREGVGENRTMLDRDAAAAVANAERAANCRGIGSGRNQWCTQLDSVPARPDTEEADADASGDLKSAIRLLTDREREVIWGRFEAGLTLLQLGERMGLSRERVRQIERHALGRLRGFLGASTRRVVRRESRAEMVARSQAAASCTEGP